VRYAILLCLAGATIAVAGCGSSGSTSSSDPGGTSGGNDPAAANQKALEFAACMRSHGVPNFPDPTGGKIDLRVQPGPNGSTNVNGADVNGPAFQSAMNSCRSYLPNGGHLTAAQTAKAHAQALAMS
jgi:hypothetical protein